MSERLADSTLVVHREPSSRIELAPALRSRRAVLAGGLGALVGLAASALGRPTPVHAADGEAVILGRSGLNPNVATATTEIAVGPDANTAFRGSADGGWAVEGLSGSGIGVHGATDSNVGVLGEAYTSGTGVKGNGAPGVWGSSSAGIGVLGESSSSIGVSGASTTYFGVAGSSGSSYGVYGESHGSTSSIGVHGNSNPGIGVLGKSRASDHPGISAWSANNSTGILGFSNDNSVGPPAPKPKTGVYGEATQDSSSRGVWGHAGSGQGVRGEATTGAGLYGTASTAAGYAVRGSGRVRFDKVSGLATLAAGTTSKTITPGTDVTSESFVLLTPMTDLGTRRLWFTRDTTYNRITIHMSSSRSSSTSIAWLLVG